VIPCVVLLSQISSLLHPLSEPLRSPSSFLLPRSLTTIHNSLPTIFFRITSFADPYPLTSIESHLYKKYPRGVTQPKSSKYPAPVPISFRIRTYERHTRNPFGIRTSKTQDLKLFRMNTYKKTWVGVPAVRNAPHPAPLAHRTRSSRRVYSRRPFCRVLP